jgi:signal transduction histidine kinase
MVFEDLLRMGREALTNAFQHFGATTTCVVIQYGAKELRLLVRDNETGVDDTVLKAAQTLSLRLPSMRERAGKLSRELTIGKTSSWSNDWRSGRDSNPRPPA